MRLFSTYWGARAVGLRALVLTVLLAGCGAPVEVAEPEAAAPASPAGQANASITILTTNAADVVGPGPPSQGEWSFSAWVEVEGRSFLFDTGWSPRNVLANAEVLGIDLSEAEDGFIPVGLDSKRCARSSPGAIRGRCRGFTRRKGFSRHGRDRTVPKGIP